MSAGGPKSIGVIQAPAFRKTSMASGLTFSMKYNGNGSLGQGRWAYKQPGASLHGARKDGGFTSTFSSFKPVQSVPMMMMNGGAKKKTHPSLTSKKDEKVYFTIRNLVEGDGNQEHSIE